jgi:trimethylamine--corrinoid protein Co-methyltransferase
MTFSLEQLVIDDMVLGLVERLLRGVTVDEETLALDLIHEIGPKGAFVTAGHTLRHFRNELLTLDLLRHQPREAWELDGAPDLRARARDEARRLLADHRPPPLPDGVAAQLDEILKEAEAHRFSG